MFAKVLVDAHTRLISETLILTGVAAVGIIFTVCDKISASFVSY